MIRSVRLPAILLLVLAVAACEESEVRLSGERISVLQLERQLQPDLEADERNIRLPAPQPNAEWPQAGGLPHHAMHHMAIGEIIERAWSRNIGEGTDYRQQLLAAPVVAAGVVYAMDAAATVSALSLADGALLWQRELAPETEDGSAILAGGLAVDGNFLYVTTGFAEVIALDRTTGADAWRQPVPGPLRAPPVINGGRLFLITIDNQVVALAARDGERLWSHTGPVEVSALVGSPGVAVDAGVVIAPLSTGDLVALRVENGGRLWSDSLTAPTRTDAVGSISAIRGRVVIDRDQIFAISHSGVLAAIDLTRGVRVWTRDIGGIDQPWIAGRYLFLIDVENQLLAVEADTGRIVWVTQLVQFEDPDDRRDRVVWGGPVLASDRLLMAGTHGVILSVSPYTGEIIGQIEISSGVRLGPIIADSTVLFLTEDGDLLAYR